jgi:hypothetical protein
MLADTSKSLSRELGILTEGEEVCYRATFIVDPQGIIRWVNVNDLSVGRNVNEVIRVLDALQTDEIMSMQLAKRRSHSYHRKIEKRFERCQESITSFLTSHGSCISFLTSYHLILFYARDNTRTIG